MSQALELMAMEEMRRANLSLSVRGPIKKRWGLVGEMRRTNPPTLVQHHQISLRVAGLAQVTRGTPLSSRENFS